MPSVPESGNMRDRRNTNLSISSLTSTSSTSSTVPTISVPVPGDALHDDVEKGRFLWVHPTANAQPLPSPLLKHARESHQTFLDRCRSHLSWKRLLVVVAAVSLFLCYHCSSWLELSSAAESPVPPPDKKLFFSPDAAIPQDPTPLIFQDDKGETKWTVSIPHTLEFPLRPHQYRNVCQASEKVGQSVAAMMARSRVMRRDRYSSKQYYSTSKSFVDVADAENMGMLPADTRHQSVSVVGRSDTNITESTTICEKSLTFVMETDKAGFGESLMSLWLAYGLAQKEGRAFFINDNAWPYGKYASFFELPPQPSCSPPPAHQVVPCPHTARHLVASAATMPWTFGAAFKDEFVRPRRSGMNKNREIYDMARTGYEHLFKLIGDDANFLEHKTSDLRKESAESGTPVVGMHIRRGDLHPYELQFSNDYLPFERFSTAAMEMLTRLNPNLTLSDDKQASILLASDDPDIYLSDDLGNTFPESVSVVRAQERIVLASKKTLPPAVPLRNGAYTKHVDENSGWEGGFYSALFFGLGGGHPSTVDPTDEEKEMMKQAMFLRELVGRGYLLDIGVLSRADAVVCASSSAACRLVGVIMGWDKVSGGQWRNVDAGRYWSFDGQL